MYNQSKLNALEFFEVMHKIHIFNPVFCFQLMASHEQELQDLEERLENDRHRQFLSLREKLNAKRNRKMDELRRKQDVESTKEMIEQRKEVDEIKLKKVSWWSN